MEEVKKGKANKFKLDDSDVLWYQYHPCVPNVQELRKLILEAAYHSAYTVHPRLTKMYQNLNICGIK